MGNVLEFYLKMKDMMSSGLIKVAQTAKQSFAQVQSTISSTVTKGSKEAVNSLDQINRKVKDIDATARGSSFMNGSLFRNLAGIIGTVSLMAFAKDSVAKAMDFGATKTSFQVLAGDANRGNALADHLNKLQQDTILGPEVFKNAQTMMGFGVGRKDGKTDISVIEHDMKMLGDVSMGNKEKFQSLTLAFSQTQAAGRLMGQDLLQYINAGFNPLQTMSERWKDFGLKSKTSVGELKKMMEKGQISAAAVAKAFEVATGKGGLFENMMDKIGKTSYGRMKVLEGAFENLKIKTGEALMPMAEGLMKVGTYLIDHVELVATAVTAWGAYKAAVMVASTWQTIINGEMLLNPIGLMIAAIAGLVVWITILSKKYKGWGDALNGLEVVCDSFLNGQKAMWSDVYGVVEYYIKLILLKIEQFREGVTATGQIAGIVMKDVATGKMGNINGDIANVLASSTGGTSAKIEALTKDWNRRHAANLGEIAYSNTMSELGMKKMSNAYKSGLFNNKDGSVSPSDIPGMGGKGTGVSDLLGGKDGTAKGITGGGPRVINIKIDKMQVADHMTVTSTGDPKKLVSEIEPHIKEMWLRTLNSGSNVQ